MRIGFAAFTAAAAVALGPVSAKAQQPVTAFVNVSVVPMDRERVLAGQTVVVQGDRIVALGPAKQVRVPDNAVRIDGRGKFLIPGLADMHMHLGIPGSGFAERLLFLLLANGVTTIRNLDYSYQPNFAFNSSSVIEGEQVLRLRERVATGELLGPRIYTSGEWHADTSKSIAANVEAYKAAGYDHIKVHDEGAPWLDSLVDAARRVGMPIAGHPVGGLPYALQHRFASVEHLIGFPGRIAASDTNPLADTINIPPLVAMARQNGVRITPTLAWVDVSAAMNAGRSIDPRYLMGRQYLPAKFKNFYNFYPVDTTSTGLRNGAMTSDTLSSAVAAAAEVRRRLIMALQTAGVEMLLGTDSPLLVPGSGVHHELAALVRAGLTPYQALRTGTRNVAAYFGTLDSTGTVAVGKRADLVLTADNPLADIRHTEQIAGVMAAGRWISSADIERRLTDYAKAAEKSGKD